MSATNQAMRPREAQHKQNGNSHSVTKETIQDKLKAIGQRVAALQQELSAASVGKVAADTVITEAWSLLLGLRPFLYLSTDAASGHELANDPVAVAFRTHERKRDLHHVGLALRLYNTLVRMTVAVPNATLHACLTLLSLLPQLSAQFAVTGSDGERYIDGLRHHLLCLSAMDAESFSRLRDALIDTVVPLALMSSAYGRVANREQVCRFAICPLNTAQLEHHAAILSLPTVESAKALFDARVVVANQADALALSRSAAHLLTSVLQEGDATAGADDGTSATKFTPLVDLGSQLVEHGLSEAAVSASPGRKRPRDEEDSADGSTQRRQSHSPADPREPVRPKCMLNTGLDLLRVLVERKWLNARIHGVPILRTVLALYCAVDHASPACTCSSTACALDACSSLIDFLDTPLRETRSPREDNWLCSLAVPLARGEDVGLLATWVHTLLDQYTHMHRIETSALTVESGSSAPFRSCIENVYRLQCVLRDALVAATATTAAPVHQLPSLHDSALSAHVDLDKALEGCLRGPLPLTWYELNEHLDGAQCPEHELWGMLLLEDAPLRTVLTVLPRLKESLSVSEGHRASVHAYAMACLAFQWHVLATAEQPNSPVSDFSSWLQSRLSALDAESTTGRTTSTFPTSLTALLEDCVHVLTHHPDPELPPLLDALTLLLRAAAQVEQPAVVGDAAITILHALDGYATTHKNAMSRSSPMAWRAVLCTVARHLPTPFTADRGATSTDGLEKTNLDDGDAQRNGGGGQQSRSSGMLRHLLDLVQRASPSLSAEARHAPVVGLMHGLALRTTQALSALAQGTGLSLAALHHQATTGRSAPADRLRAHRASDTMRRCAGTLATLVEEAQPVLMFLVKHLFPASTQWAQPDAALDRRGPVNEEEDTKPDAARIAASHVQLMTDTMPFLVSLAGVVLLAREWISQAPTIRNLFSLPVYSDSLRLSATGAAEVVDVDDDENSDAEMAIDRTKDSLTDDGPQGSLSVFPPALTRITGEGIGVISSRFLAGGMPLAECQALSQTLACLAIIAPQDDRADTHLVAAENIQVTDGATAVESSLPLALSTIVQQRHGQPTPPSVVASALTPLLRPPQSEEEASQELAKSRLVASLFSGSSATSVAKDAVAQLAPKAPPPLVSHHADALADCLCILSDPNHHRSAAWDAWARELLVAYAASWPPSTQPVSPAMDIRAYVLDAATAVLRSLSCRPEDLLRRAPHLVTSDFLAQLCQRFTLSSPGTCLRTAMDLVVPKLVFHADWSIADVEQAVAQLEEVSEAPVANSCLEPSLAYILLQYGSSPDDALDALRRLFQYLHVQLEELPRMTVNCVPLTILHLLSATGDAQLTAWRHTEMQYNAATTKGLSEPPVGSGAVDSVSFSFFEQAAQELITLTESVASEKEVRAAFASPVSAHIASQAMVTHVFDVLDRIMKCMGVTLTQSTIESPVPQLQMSQFVSVQSSCRWLLALATFLKFLGPHTTLMMAKLPPILETCCTEPALVRVACAVWCELVEQCTDEYLNEHAATIVVDLVGLELYAAAMDDAALSLLSLAMSRVFAKSAAAPFWQSYFKVLGGLSRLVASVQPQQEAASAGPRPSPVKSARGRGRLSARKPQTTSATTEAGLSGDLCKDAATTCDAEAIASGFSFIMNSSSSKCKAIFVRALHRFLSEADSGALREMTEAAITHPLLIPTLLQCSRELEPADVLDALSCVGMIGAVAPQTVSLSVAAQDGASGPPGLASSSSSSALPVPHLQVGSVVQWRHLAFVLLNEYCTRALANTSDPAIYDRAGYAVQELLLLFTRRERTAANGAPLLKGDVLHVNELEQYSWWNKLDKRSKQLLEGFTTTRYAAHRHTPSEPTYPAYHPGMPYSHWLHALFKSLAPKCDAKFSQMMAALRNVSRRDIALVTFLIPHMIANILEASLDDTDESIAAVEIVRREIDVLLSAAIHGAEHGGNEMLSLRSQTALEAYTGTNNTAAVSGGRAAADASRVDEHVQFILRMLEDLQQVRWSLLRMGRRLEPLPPSELVTEERCLKLADRYHEFLSSISVSNKVLAAIEIGSNMRALRCLESQSRITHVAAESKDIPLQRIFAALGDRDSAKSIHRLMRGLQPEKAAFSYENSGDWQQAIQNCELVLQHKPHSVAHQFTALRCMRQLGQLHFMSRYAQSLLEEAKQTVSCAQTRSSASVMSHRQPWASLEQTKLPLPLPDSIATLRNYANEAAWRLGEWDKVECMDELPASLAAPVARWVELLHGKASADTVSRATHSQRCKLTPIIQRTCRENYTQCYPYVAMLHTLADLDSVCKLTNSNGAWSGEKQKHLVDTLRERLDVTDVSLEAREPMLSLHRAIFSALGLHEQVSITWLEHARLLRDAGFPEAALIAARQSSLAVQTPPPSYYTLAAELLYEMKAPMQAVEFVSEHVNDGSMPADLRADLQVMMTNWRLETGSQSKDEVIGAYRKALEFQETEKGHHHLALFLDKLYTVNVDSVEADMRGIPETDKVSVSLCHVQLLQLIEDYAVSAVVEYAKALLAGHETVSVSLPRLLTLWLDSAVKLHDVKIQSARSSVDADRLLKTLNRSVEVFLFDKQRSVAPQILVTALPQLLSRLCHPCEQVVKIITRAVVLLMTHFPQPCLWMVMPIAFSKQVQRMNVVKKTIVPMFLSANPAHKQILQNVFEIFVALIELCNCPASTFANNAKLTKQPFIQKVQTILQSTHFIVPTMANLSPCITASELSEVFPSSPTFWAFGDRVDVMASLQKPKRVWVDTNEGTTVSFLCKSKDEPRKDIRMMEVASLMNTFFLKDPSASRRNFSLRRYAIAALTDDCALIEWVNNISTLRAVVTQCYGLDGSGVRISQVKAWQAKVENKSLTKLDMFKKHILPAAPPVLHQWFDATFASNDQWYHARNLFTQSTALWSIAGHVIGLGDRHGENLMIDMRAGEMLHVDFACLFDKGETLDVPERVRFRLTQNLVDAMGVLGTDGQFRANCEIAMRCQMQNKNAVMSVVETLLHDPLVEWTQKSSRPSVDPSRLIQRVSRRLDGFLDLYSVPPEKDTMALNVEGQVSKLISHSSAVESLCEMYIWWMAWV